MWFEVKPDETDGSEQDVFKKLCKETKTPGIIAYGSPSPRQCNLLRVSDEGQIIGKYMFLSDRRNDGEYWLSNDDYGCFSIGPVDGPDHGRWPIMGDNLKARSEEHTSELQSLMRNSYAVFCLKKKKHVAIHNIQHLKN